MNEKLNNILKSKLTNKERNILSATLGIWGIILIGSGLILNSVDRTIVEKNYKVNINQKQIAQQRTNEIKLKDIEIEENSTLSVFVSDYLDNVENISKETLSLLKLDTSNVKTTEAGTYTYTVSYKKKKYNGTITVKEKEKTESGIVTPNSTPNVTLQLKEIKEEVGTALDASNYETYISTPLTDEMKNNIVIDITKVNNTIAGTYQYTVKYNNVIYTGNITFYNPKPIVPSTTPDEKEQENQTSTQ